MLPDVQDLQHVPVSRFRREFRKWLRSDEVIAITRSGSVILITLPWDLYWKHKKLPAVDCSDNAYAT